jgi:hypothetical protein
VETSLLRQFQREIERQCQFGMIALQDMDEAAADGDGKLFWYSVQGLLFAAENISKLLWPPSPGSGERGLSLGRTSGLPTTRRLRRGTSSSGSCATTRA